VIIAATPITAEDYRRYGDVLSADRADIAARDANQGTAVRRNHQIELLHLRPDARANFSSFRCAPRTEWPMPLLMLEKHPCSTQTFVPMNASRYLVVVAMGGSEPDLSTLRAFIAEAGTAVSYRPGVWHHPMIALDRVTDFACLVWEDGTSEDAVEHQLAAQSLFLEVDGPARPDTRADATKARTCPPRSHFAGTFVSASTTCSVNLFSLYSPPWPHSTAIDVLSCPSASRGALRVLGTAVLLRSSIRRLGSLARGALSPKRERGTSRAPPSLTISNDSGFKGQARRLAHAPQWRRACATSPMRCSRAQTGGCSMERTRSAR
jgi:ureidoglycolate lyase